MQCHHGDIPLRDIKDGLELKLTLDGKVLDSKMILPVVSERLVERSIFLLRNVTRVTRPDGFRLVELFVDLTLLLDLLCLLFVLGFVLIVVNLLDLGLSFFIFSFLDLFLLVILNLLRHVIRDD